MNHDTSLARALPGTGNSVNFSGKWINELGSTVTLLQADDNSLSGSYESATSASENPTTGRLSGYVDGDLIAFTVYWNEFQSITAWVGQSKPGTNNTVFSTLWQMTSQVAVGDEWASINAGADTFTAVQS